MNYAACSFACCSFNGRYIYKFGGVGDQNVITYFIVKNHIIQGNVWWKNRIMEDC